MPKTMFTAEELSTFIRKSIVVCVAVTVINGVAIFLTTCAFKKENQALQTQISTNSSAFSQLNTTVATDIEADKKWREEFGKANPKTVVPKVIEPTPVPERSGRRSTPPPTVIVIPSPPPIIKTETRTKKIYLKPKPTATPPSLFNWGPKSRNKR